MNVVCIDGDFVGAEAAKISVWDHGFLYGDAVFETMRAYGGRVFALEEHLKRLRQGAEILRLQIPQSDAELGALLHETVKRNDLADAYLRLTCSRGPGPIGIDPALCSRSTLVIMAKPPAAAEKLYSEGVSLGICPVRRNHPLALPPAVKSANFLNNILAKIWAKEAGYTEALLLSQEGWVSETTVSNIFFVRGNHVFTPAAEVGILQGVTRKYVAEVIKALQLPLTEGRFKPDELFKASEIFLTNSGSEVIPVTALDGRTVGKGVPGELTKQIHSALRQAIGDYCSNSGDI